MPQPGSLICYCTRREIVKDGTGSKVAGLQSEVGYWIAGQYCDVYVLWRGTTGLSLFCTHE